MRWILAAAGGLAVLFGARSVRDRRALDAQKARRADASADALAEEARASIARYGFAIPGAAARFEQEPAWTDVTLLAALDAFYGEAVRYDDRHGQSGRDGEVFAFYDAGLAGLSEVLAKRMARSARGER